VIVTGPTGEMAWSFNTPGMYRAKTSAGGARVVAFYGDDQ
jgi:beta-aspartyl-peptidase (threonine type)